MVKIVGIRLPTPVTVFSIRIVSANSRKDFDPLRRTLQLLLIYLMLIISNYKTILNR